jgi:hypothetical protein
MFKQIIKNKPHIIWNWEQSSDEFKLDDGLVRYHFLFADDSAFDKKNNLRKVYSTISEINSGIISVREKNGKIRNSNLSYLLVSFDSVVSPKILNFGEIHIPMKKDFQLCERMVLNIEDYIYRLYE